MKVDSRKLATRSLTQLYHNGILTKCGAEQVGTALGLKIDVLSSDSKETETHVLPLVETKQILPVVKRAKKNVAHHDLMFISLMYSSGIGVRRDPVLADVWRSFAHKVIPTVEGKELDYAKCHKALRKEVKPLKHEQYAYIDAVAQHYIDMCDSCGYTGKVKDGKHFIIPRPTGLDVNLVYTKQLTGEYRLYAAVNEKYGFLPNIVLNKSPSIPEIIKPKLKSPYVVIATRAVVTNLNVYSTVEPTQQDILLELVNPELRPKSFYAPEFIKEYNLTDEQVAEYKQTVANAKKRKKGSKWSKRAKQAYKEAKRKLKEYKIYLEGKKLHEEARRKKTPVGCTTFYAFDLFTAKSDQDFLVPRVEYSRIQALLGSLGFAVIPAIHAKYSTNSVNKLRKQSDMEFTNVLVRNFDTLKGKRTNHLPLQLWGKP